MKAILVAGALALALLFSPVVSVPAFADTVTVSTPADTPPVIAATPEAVTAAKEDTSVTIEVGNMVNYAVKTLSGVFSAIILAALTWGATFIPGLAGLTTRTLIARFGEKFVQNITDYAVNAVQGATKDKKLDINVGSAVVATAIERALTLQNEDKFLKWIMGQLGGAQGIGEKVFRKIDLEEGASRTNVLAPAVAQAINRYPMKR